MFARRRKAWLLQDDSTILCAVLRCSAPSCVRWPCGLLHTDSSPVAVLTPLLATQLGGSLHGLHAGQGGASGFP